ncbi:MmgE/PrpD family protein [Alkalilacustris brevis]|uniref:MmgE/PrpD family protein n=1 Tax=Alkalilacustris brevis TaxID=2026338 RepID=UPI000E0DBD68|nr:MmgE/PrpD family protein [Alkalilacustris brevis]
MSAVAGETTLSANMAGFVAADHPAALDDPLCKVSKRAVLDTLGVMISGLNDPVADILIADAKEQGGLAEVPLPGGNGGPRVPARAAALIFGTLGHVDDWDDTQISVNPEHRYGLLMHPSAPVLGALLALAGRHASQGHPLSGARLLQSYAVGVEICCKLSEWSAPAVYERGFQSTAVWGGVGAAAACAHAVGLDRDTAAQALGIAATRSAGLRTQYGTRIKAMHAGFAAQAGVLAVDLAQRGIDANRDSFDGNWGLPTVLSGAAPQTGGTAFGSPWSAVDPGLSIKPYPSGILTHQTMDALLDLMIEHDLGAEDIAKITVKAGRNITQAIHYPRAATPLEAKFCMPALLAMIALARRAGAAEFRQDFIDSDEFQDMQARIALIHDPDIDAQGFGTIRSCLTLRLHDGRSITREADPRYRGGPERPFSNEDLLCKLQAAASGRLGPPQCRVLAERVGALVAEPDASFLLEYLAIG